MTHGRLSSATTPEGWLVWTINADPDVHLRAKRIFGKLETGLWAHWCCRTLPETCRDLEWFMQRYPLAMSPEDEARLRAPRRRITRCCCRSSGSSAPTTNHRPSR